jgi:hypothetical protein
LRRSNVAVTVLPLYVGLVPSMLRSLFVDEPALPTNARLGVPESRFVPENVIVTGEALGSLLPASGETPDSGAPLTMKHCEQVAVVPSVFVTTTSRLPVGVLKPTVQRRWIVVLVVILSVMSLPLLS